MQPQTKTAASVEQNILIFLCRYMMISRNYLISINRVISTIKMDLNRYCIRKPQQTFFLRVTNENLLAWGIEVGDILIIEQREQINEGDLVVIEQDAIRISIEYFAMKDQQYVFFSLDSNHSNLTIKQLTQLNIQGVVASTIHQLKNRKAA